MKYTNILSNISNIMNFTNSIDSWDQSLYWIKECNWKLKK